MEPEKVYLTQEDKEILQKYKSILKYNKYNELMADLINNPDILKKSAICISSPLYIGFIQLLISLDIDFYSDSVIIPGYIFKNCRFTDKNVVLNNCASIGDYAFHGAFLDSLKAPKCKQLGESVFARSTINKLELPGLEKISTTAFNEMNDLTYLDLSGLNTFRCLTNTFKNSYEIKTLVLGKNTEIISGRTDKPISDEDFSFLYSIKNLIRV